MRMAMPHWARWAGMERWGGLRALREFFAYHGVWAVGVRALRSLSVRNKILAVLSLVILPLLPMAGYVVLDQTGAVRLAERQAAGARLIGFIYAVDRVLHDSARQLERSQPVDQPRLAAALLALRQAGEQAAESGLSLTSAWEGAQPALARLEKGGRLGAAGQMEALSLASAALGRVHQSAVQQSGFLLTRDLQLLAHGALLYLYMPHLHEYFWQLQRAIATYTGAQDALADGQMPPLETLMPLAGRVQAFELSVQRIAPFLGSASMNEQVRPSEREVRALRSFAALSKAALMNDGYFSAGELVEIRAAIDGAAAEIDALRAQQLDWLVARYAAKSEAKRQQRLLVTGGTALSLALSLYLFYAFYLVMRGGLNTLNDQMRRMSTGDLSVRARPRGGDEVAETMRAASLSVERLGELLSHVRHGSGSVSQAAQQIAFGNADLRSRNHRISDALQKVVDGVARYSSQLEASSTQVERVVGTTQALRLQSARSRRQMDELRESLTHVQKHSREITEAVSLIDNVAFRTNILALNASVEASKAGEAGKGFAVVAQEVRSLAQRSAEAARRINSIVSASGSHVQRSGILAEDTGRGIAESDGHIDAIHGAMADVAALTREGQQESGAILEQVRELRETTEKNLGLVEQLANASHSLRSHGERLTHRLSHFKLG